jgi:pimeloyl-ACP methyl ester carboxylesterase
VSDAHTQMPMPQLDGVEHRHLDVLGAKLHVAEAGSGPPVLLVHGWPQHWWVWRRVLPELASERRVICVDLRGFGWSEAPVGSYELPDLASDLLVLLDLLELERVDLIGHDWGGYLGFLLCLRAPERIDHYLAMGIIHPWFEPPSPTPKALRRLAYQFLMASPGVGAGVLQRVPAFVRAVLEKASHPDTKWTREELDCFAESFRQPGHARASSHLYRSFLTREAPRLRAGHYRSQRLTVPTRLLLGEADRVIRPAALEGFQPYVEEMSIEVVPGAGHFVAEERPDVVLARARELFGAPA